MKHRNILLASILFFLFINTSYFWELLPGLWDMIISALLLLYFIVLGTALLVQIYYLIKERLKDKTRIISTSVLLVVIIITIYFPTGIINFRKIEGQDILVAYREGVANCTTTIKLKANNKFIKEEICFGVDRHKGTYEIKGDTLFLKFNNPGAAGTTTSFGILDIQKDKNGKVRGQLLYYFNRNERNPVPLVIKEYKI